MDELSIYSQNKDCVSVKLRNTGNSDECIVDLLNILYKIAGDEPTANFNNHEFLSLFQSIMFDIQTFTPFDANGKIFGIIREELLSNRIYRKLLVYVIININTFDITRLDILCRLFSSLEENAIGGCIYISLHGRAYRPILELFQRYNVELRYDWHYVDQTTQIQRQLVICNLPVITLIQSRIESLET